MAIEQDAYRHSDEVNRLLNVSLPIEDALGYHGTSRQALNHLAINGCLPSSFGWREETYYFPCHDPDDDVSPLTAYRDAATFAIYNSVKAHVADELPFTPSQTFMQNLTFALIEGFGVSDAEDIMAEESSQYGLRQEELVKLVTLARASGNSGVVVAISLDAANNFEVVEGGTGLSVAKLSIDYLLGIERQ
jgi:hypothetical protein